MISHMDLTLNQKALWYAALYKDPTAPVDYIPGRVKNLKKTLQTTQEQKDLVSVFAQDPKETLAYCRQALQHIANDKNLTEPIRQDRVRRYVKQYLEMIIALDKEAFLHDANKVYNWIPDYIPDWFVDMWSDSKLQTNQRSSREKIIIDKKKIFDETYELLVAILWNPYFKKQSIVDYLYHYVAKKPYSHAVAQTWFAGQSIKLHDIVDNNEMVCRHKALLFQVLAQACGITSRLLKCDIQFWNWDYWAHAANLIRLDYTWYLVDTTNPIKWNDWKIRYAITPIPEKDIELNKQKHQWTVDKNIVIPRKYTSRNNMFYQVR